MRVLKGVSVLWCLSVAALSRAAEEPCYGHAYDDRVEGEHFWVEWQPDLIASEDAVVLLDAMEDAWVRFIDEMGWRAPHPSIVVAVEEAPVDGTAGICQTRECDGGHFARIQIFDTHM